MCTTGCAEWWYCGRAVKGRPYSIASFPQSPPLTSWFWLAALCSKAQGPFQPIESEHSWRSVGHRHIMYGIPLSYRGRIWSQSIDRRRIGRVLQLKQNNNFIKTRGGGAVKWGDRDWKDDEGDDPCLDIKEEYCVAFFTFQTHPEVSPYQWRVNMGVNKEKTLYPPAFFYFHSFMHFLLISTYMENCAG